MKAIKAQMWLPATTSTIYYHVQFEQLIYDLLELNATTEEEINRRFYSINLGLKNYYCSITIQADLTEINRPLNPMIPGLQKIFSNGHFCTYKRSIVYNS